MPDIADRLADRIVEASTVAGISEPRVRGTDWRPAVVTAVNSNGTVNVGDIVARRLDSYLNPTVGDTIALSRSGPGNWLAEGRLAAAADGAWTTYTPGWTGTTNPSLGNGSLVGRYTRIGRTIIGGVVLTIGSTTTGGSGSWSWDLPFLGAPGITLVCVCEFLRSGANRFDGHGVVSPNATQIGLYMPVIASSASQVVRMGATASPLSPSSSPTYANSWSSGDQLRMTFQYEAAS